MRVVPLGVGDAFSALYYSSCSDQSQGSDVNAP